MAKWKLKRTVQCAKCPWRKDVDPHDIPNGYDEQKHRALKNTIAESDFSCLAKFLAKREMHVMACHETHDAYCLGWLAHQTGPGNNLGLRMHLMNCENVNEVKLIGEQHETFEDTLPQ